MPNYFSIKELSGHIGRIDRREKMTLFSVAYNPGKKEENKPTCWFQCKAVGDLHYQGMPMMEKGDGIVITSMKPEVWKDKDNNDRWTWIVFEARKWEKTEGQQTESSTSFNPDDDLPF